MSLDTCNTKGPHATSDTSHTLHVQAVTRALPLETCNNWTVAPDSVQAVSCMVTALNLFNVNGKDFLYESSVEGVLHVLKHLGQSPAYLGIIAGALQCCQLRRNSHPLRHLHRSIAACDVRTHTKY